MLESTKPKIQRELVIPTSSEVVRDLVAYTTHGADPIPVLSYPPGQRRVADAVADRMNDHTILLSHLQNWVLNLMRHDDSSSLSSLDNKTGIGSAPCRL